LPAWGRKEKTETKTTGTQQIVLEKNAVEEMEEKKTETVQTFVQVTGRVRLVGGGPIPEIVITGQDREWYVSREDEHLLKELQHRTLTVEGFETVVELRFANGLPAGQRRTLKDIKIISVE
jgi:hypothetical protein